MCGVAIADRADHLAGMEGESDIFGNYPHVGAFLGSYQVPAIGRIGFGPLCLT
jgi:hypothetical protein